MDTTLWKWERYALCVKTLLHGAGQTLIYCPVVLKSVPKVLTSDNGVRIFVGMVRMTRIAHTTALAVQMRSGDLSDRLCVLVCLHSQMPRLHRQYIETALNKP